MANVHITSDYTITNVNFCNTASDAQTWWQVEYENPDQPFPFYYVTPYNDAKYPRGLAKADFLANVMPSLSEHITIITTCSTDDLASWDTED
jgi:hypothetical protein